MKHITKAKLVKNDDEYVEPDTITVNFVKGGLGNVQPSSYTEIMLKSKGDMPSSLGFGLFKMWVGATAELDTELMQKFSLELAYFSKKGNIPE